MTYRREVEITEQPAPPATVVPQTTVVTPPPAVVQPAYVERPVRRYGPSGLGILERWIVFIFGLIQLLIGLRILLLLIAARESNNIVSGIYNLSEIFVAPFRGILAIREVQAGASELDVAAIVALVGWFVIELIVLALIRVFRPSTTA
jgi:uncharacterized protein YggT (Ycf19 family)